MLPNGYSPFTYPANNLKKHEPYGYADYGSYRDWLRDDYLFRCCYCLVREQWYAGSAVFHIDHIQSQRSKPGLSTDYANLAYSCAVCNLAKKGKCIPDPSCLTSKTVRINEDGSYCGETTDAALLIDALLLNRKSAKDYRLRIRALSNKLRRWPDQELLAFFEYPVELPDLSGLRPKGNRRPKGVSASCFERRLRGKLPPYY